MDGTWAQNPDGSWSQATPEPFWIGFRLRKAKCDCGKVFRNRPKYREHYALAHTDGKRYNRTPKGMRLIKEAK